MTKRGWTPAELTPLFECLDVSGVGKGASVLMKGRTIDFVVLVIRGAVTHRAKRHLPGEIVGADNVISGYPLLDDATCESVRRPADHPPDRLAMLSQPGHSALTDTGSARASSGRRRAGSALYGKARGPRRGAPQPRAQGALLASPWLFFAHLTSHVNAPH